MIDLRAQTYADSKQATVTAQTDLEWARPVTLTRAFITTTIKRQEDTTEGRASRTGLGPFRTEDVLVRSPKGTAT